MLRPRLSYANVAATIAVVLAMSGTAVAVTSIDGSSINNRSIAGKKLIRNTVTGTEIKENTLTKVPEADRLDTLDSTSFVHGSKMRTVHVVRSVPTSDDNVTEIPLLSVPGFGLLSVQCLQSAKYFHWEFKNQTTSIQRHIYSSTGYSIAETQTNAVTVGAGATSGGNYDGTSQADADLGYVVDLTAVQVSTQRAADIHLSIDVHAGAGDMCQVAGTATTY